MPLVQRTSTQGNLFREDEEPPNWQNADLWSDTNSTPRALFINDAGTALRLGFPNFDKTGNTEESASSADAFLTFRKIALMGNAFTQQASVTVAVDSGDSIVIITGVANFIGTGGLGTSEMRLREDSTTLTTRTGINQTADNTNRLFILVEIQTGVSSGNHSYNLQVRHTDATQEGYGGGIISASVVNSG